MEYLVDMSTHVPDGTSPDTVDDIRVREAVRARELAAEGHLLRLWLPPLAPGQWRTLGLFAAADANELEHALASMPLRIWRTDTVTPLAEHPNDPGNRTSASLAAEFLAFMTITTPEEATAAEIADRAVREAIRAGELAQQEVLRRLWALAAPAGRQRTLGLWSAADEPALTATLRLLPWYDWMVVTTTPLSAHPNDPLTPSSS